MQIGEGVAALVEFMVKDQENKCDYEPEKTNWKAVLAGNSGTLGTNMGNKPDATCKAELSRTSFPSQAHHLIPNARLNPNAKDGPPHQAHKLLIEGDYLYADTDYDINHKKNGKWMPYAHRLKEWISKAKIKSEQDTAHNKELMYDVMSAANIQMHQGSHSYERFGTGEAGYLKRVDQYLDKIKLNAISHFLGSFKCEDCSNKKENGKYPPRTNTIRYFDEASKLIRIDINKCRIFVSKHASEFHEERGFIFEDNA